MEENRFFNYVWRINGLLLLLAGLLALALLAFAGYQIYEQSRRGHQNSLSRNNFV